MKKNRIRLTESDLHKIIKESVNKVLTELDWKTYANASQKRKEQDDLNKAHTLKLYAGKQFQGKHDLPNLEKPYSQSHNDYPMDDYSYIDGEDALIYAGEICPKFSDDYARTTLQHKKGDEHPRVMRNGTHWHDFNDEHDDTELVHLMTRNGEGGFKRGYKDLDDYYNGKYEYIKGKGWQLKH